MNIDIITSNTAQPKINPFVKFIWEEQHWLEFVSTIVLKSTTVYIYIDIKQALGSWLHQVLTGCHVKIKLAEYISDPLFTLLL